MVTFYIITSNEVIRRGGGGFDNLQLFVWVNIIISCIYGYFLENWGYIYQINESLKDFTDESYKKKNPHWFGWNW